MIEQLKSNMAIALSPELKSNPSVNIVLVYVGSLPNYFPLFLRSCASNPSFNWTLATTNALEFDLPTNVRRVSFDLEDLRDRVAEKLNITPDVRWPYKICDFRPAFGFLFPEWFRGYDFWGHCDADMVFGDLRRFFPGGLFESSLKIQMRGALGFYKNDEIGNALFRMPHPTINYREVFSNYKYCGFDEWEGIFKLMRLNGVGFSLSNDLAEIDVARYDLRLNHRTNHAKQLFTWENGRILRTDWVGGQEVHDEYSYIHLQKRQISRFDVAGHCAFAFLPGQIVSFRDQAEKMALAGQNRRSRVWEMQFHAGRVSRYLRSLGLVDRRYWRLRE